VIYLGWVVRLWNLSIGNKRDIAPWFGKNQIQIDTF